MASVTRVYKDFRHNESDKACSECWQHIQSKEGIGTIQQIMQNQNQFLKSMLIELLDELKKSAVDRDVCVCVEGERSSDSMKKELKKLQKENKKIKENLSEKQANLAKCLAVLENNNCEIDKLSKHIEDLCAERDKFREQLKRLHSILNKKDATISSLQQINYKNSTIITEKESLSQEVDCLKQQLKYCKKQISDTKKVYYQDFQANKKNSNVQTVESEYLDLPPQMNGLVDRIESVEKELEASHLELLEYEEENRCYCQKIESLLKTIKCLQEANLRSDEDNKEYFERLNSMRKEFQDMCEEKNKTIEELNNKLHKFDAEGYMEEAIAEKDSQIKDLKERLVCLDSEHKQCKLMESKYKDCQLQFESCFKQIKALQDVLCQIYSKLDVCDKTIKELENRNKLLENNISSLQCSLESKIKGIEHWDRIIKELHCINLKLQKELRNKETVINNLEECLDKSNEILLNCEKEMNLVEEHNSKFQKEMCCIKNKLETELLQNQCLLMKCDLLKGNKFNSSKSDHSEDNTKYRSMYNNLLAEVKVKKQNLNQIKTELVDCFNKENQSLKLEESYKPNYSSENLNSLNCQCNSEVSSKSKTAKSKEHRSRSKSPHRKSGQRCKSCPESKINYKNLKKPPSEPNLHKFRRKHTKSPTKSPTKCSYQSSFENFKLERLPVGVKSLLEHKNNKNKIRSIRSDSNLKTITIKIFDKCADTCTSKFSCKCMTLISRKYKNDNKHCKHF